MDRTKRNRKKRLEASFQQMVVASKTRGCPTPRKRDGEGSALNKLYITPSKAQGSLWKRGRKKVTARRQGKELCFRQDPATVIMNP